MTGPDRQISYFSLTAGASLLALNLRDRFGGNAYLPRCHALGCGHCDPFDSIAEALPERFRAGDTVVCIMAAGIVFRVLGPHLGSKQEDPAVIVLDEDGRHVVPLLGGHAAGANRLAEEIAAFLGGRAAITTASDALGLIAPDELARGLGLAIDDPVALRKVTALLVDGKRVCIESQEDPQIDGYSWVPPQGETAGFDGRLLISEYIVDKDTLERNRGSVAAVPTARLIPRTIVAGVGCKKGVPAGEILDAIGQSCDGAGLDRRAIGAIASIDLKSDEPGLAEAARALSAATIFFRAEELAAAHAAAVTQGSSFVEGVAGTPAVCEPAALLAARRDGDGLIAGKRAFGRVTVALASRLDAALSGKVDAAPAGKVDASLAGKVVTSPVALGQSSGRVLVVGTGAGTAPLLTAQADAALREADVIMGYRTYVEQVRDMFPGKEFKTGAMGAELERCREALELAAAGSAVALISSGDPGVYGMAGPLLELAGVTPVAIVPGVTAAQIAAARLGAPLMNDYITLSLSDLLTPREEVLRRARLAAASDMVVCLYNPTSRKRRLLFEKVCRIFAKSRPADTPVGWVRDAGGAGETAGLTTIDRLADEDIDMRTIVIVGNSRTLVTNGRMVTGRGYERKQKRDK